MTEFDIYAFADYSGSKFEYQQKKAIALSIISNHKNQLHTNCYTRKSLRKAIQSLLSKASSEKKRVIFGFDHSYSFPIGFYEVVTGKRWKTWEQLLDLLCNGTQELRHVNDEPREWAKIANSIVCKHLKTNGRGPFWGPHSNQLTKPKFPFNETFKERRLVEEICSKTKSIYQIGGAGAVGLQSLYGIQHLAKLRHDLKINGIELFCWPFDGWDLPSKCHVLVEIYPRLFNKKTKSDAEDAKACSKWLCEQDKKNKLQHWMDPNNLKLEENERQRVSLEGWIVGVNKELIK